MEKEVVYALAEVIIAFSTFYGVAVASVYYMAEIKILSSEQIILAEVIYILSSIILLLGIKSRLK